VGPATNLANSLQLEPTASTSGFQGGPSTANTQGSHGGTVSRDEVKRMIADEINDMEEQRIKKKQRASTTGFTFELPLSKATNQQMAQYLLNNANLVEVDDVLTCKPREPVAALKWLQLHAKRVSLDSWFKNYQQLRDAKRMEGNEAIECVKETVYYPLLLAFFEAAALGQSDIQFLKQNYSKPHPVKIL